MEICHFLFRDSSAPLGWMLLDVEVIAKKFPKCLLPIEKLSIRDRCQLLCPPSVPF
jgi:hypothetical protein